MNSNEDVWLVGQYLNAFPISKDLPTNGIVFRRFMYIINVEKLNKVKSAYLVSKELIDLWNKNQLKYCMKATSIRNKLLSFYKNWARMKKNSKRSSEAQIECQKKFTNSLHCLFDIGVLAKSRKEIDKRARSYLEVQRNRTLVEESSTSAPSDSDTVADSNAHVKISQESPDFQILQSSDFESSSESPKKTSSGSEFTDLRVGESKQTKNKAKKIKCRPSPVINFEVASALDRCKVSDRNAVYLISSIARALGNDISSLTLNRESIRTARAQIRLQYYKDIKDSFKPNVKLTVHWDSKLLPNISSSAAMAKTDRLAVVVSGDGVRKLLSVPIIPNSTGKAQADAVYGSLTDWDIENRCVS